MWHPYYRFTNDAGALPPAVVAAGGAGGRITPGERQQRHVKTRYVKAESALDRLRRGREDEVEGQIQAAISAARERLSAKVGLAKQRSHGASDSIQAIDMEGAQMDAQNMLLLMLILE